jgi:DNA polymerase-3 subunit epsilon
MQFIAVDVETANENMASICQIGLVRFVDGVEVDAAVHLVNPRTWFSGLNTSIHGIDERTVKGAKTFPELYPTICGWTSGATVVCHTHFDRVSFGQACETHRLAALDCTWLDSAKVARRTWTQFAQRGYGLANVADFCGIQFEHHDALHDARTAGLILLRAMQDAGISLSDCLKQASRPFNVRRVGDGDGALVGEALVFTGALTVPRVQAADMAALAGANVQAGVTKHTTLLVVGDQDIAKLNGHEKSGKHMKAESLIAAGQPIRIIGESDFMRLAAITD